MSEEEKFECSCGCGHEHHHDDDCDCGCEHTMILTLDDGTEMECHVIGIFEVGDKEYIALLPIDDETVLIYQYDETEENVELSLIEDDEEYEEVTKVFFEIFNDEGDFEAEEEE